jgi:hypothetical protein
MPKVAITDSKGLVQSSGSGITVASDVTSVTGARLSSIVYSADTAVAVAQGNNDVTLTIPANAVILDIGYVCTTQIDADTGTTITFSAGLASSYTDFITPTQLNVTNNDITAGVVQSSLSANLPHATGLRIPVMLPAVARFSTAAATMNIRMTVGAVDLTTAGAYRGFVEYIVVK